MSELAGMHPTERMKIPEMLRQHAASIPYPSRRANLLYAAAEEIATLRIDIMRLEHKCASVGDWMRERDRAELAEHFLRSEGYRECDIAACNCGLWHGSNWQRRYNDLRDSLREEGEG